MPDASAQLDYAPAPPVLRRRWVRRVILGMVLLGAIAAGAWWGPAAYRRASLLYWQRQCLRYTAADERVVYESDSVAGAALRSADAHYRLVGMRSWAQRLTFNATGDVPDCWLHMQAASGVPWTVGPVLFLHERTTPAGQRRLVVVTGSFNPDELPLFIAGYDAEILTIEPGTSRTLPQNRTGGVALSVLSGSQPKPPHLRVFAGQADPADPSHFTIRYETDGVEHVVDGRLRDGWPAGYDSVEFKVRGR